MDRSTFIEALTCMSRDEIAKFILEKGKEPKPIRPFVMFPYESDCDARKERRK